MTTRSSIRRGGNHIKITPDDRHQAAISKAQFLNLVREKEGLMSLTEISLDCAKRHWDDWGREMFQHTTHAAALAFKREKGSSALEDARRLAEGYGMGAQKMAAMQDHPNCRSVVNTDFEKVEQRAIAHAIGQASDGKPFACGRVMEINYDSREGMTMKILMDFVPSSGLEPGTEVTVDVKRQIDVYRTAAMHIGGTMTGRWSSKNPGFEQCPAKVDPNYADKVLQHYFKPLDADEFSEIVRRFVRSMPTARRYVLEHIEGFNAHRLREIQPQDRRSFISTLEMKLRHEISTEMADQLLRCYSGEDPATSERPRLMTAPQGFTRDYEDRDQVEVYHADTGDAVEGALESNGRTYVVVRDQDGNEQTRIGPYRVRLKNA